MPTYEPSSPAARGLTLGAATAGLAALIYSVTRRRSRRPAGRAVTAPAPTFSPGGPRTSEQAGVGYALPPEIREVKQAAELPAPAQTNQAAAISNLPAGASPIPERAAPGQPHTNHWTPPTRYMVGAGLTLAVIWVIAFSRPAFSLLIVSFLIALVARPVINFFNKRLKLQRFAAVLLSYLLIAFLLATIPIFLLPNLARSVQGMVNVDWQATGQAVAANVQEAADFVAGVPLVGDSWSASLKALAGLAGGAQAPIPEKIVEEVTLNEAVEDLGRTLGRLAGLVNPLVAGVLAFVFTIMISLHMSLVGSEIRNWILSIVPQPYKPEINALLSRLQKIWSSFLGGQMLLMFTMGLFVFVVNTLLGTRYPLLLGVVSGFLEFIPSLGPFLAWIPAVLLALLFGSSRFPGMDPLLFALVLTLAYFVIQGLENQLLVPVILGDAVDLPPLVVIVGVTIAGITTGVVGLFIAAPLIASGREIFLYLYDKVIDPVYHEPEPPPEPGLGERLRGFFTRRSGRNADAREGASLGAPTRETHA